MLPARIAVRRPVTTSMFVVAVCLFGFVSLDRLALNLLPDISYPSLTIQTTYEDAAPEEIEALITRPVEESVGVSAGLTRLSSVSRPGQSEVVLEFGWGVNMDLASIEVREKLDLLTLPEDADKPVILRFDPSYDPIMRVQLHSAMSLSRLRTVAEEEMKKRLESVDGVAAIKVAGGREEQIRVEINEKKLAELGIPITEVTRVLQRENLNQASGSLYDLDANYLVRMLNEFRTVEEIRGIIIRDASGRRVLLGDVADVQRGTKERGVITRYNGEESVELAIYKEGDANTVQVAQAVKARLDSLKGQQGFPKNLEWAVVFDQAEFISESVSDVLSAALLGGLLATLILFLFLRDIRSTLIIALSIPVSILATFALMYQTGITLNIMSLGGVALGVGMLVDNSIVVLEAVDRYRRQGGSVREQVYRGTREVGGAVTASTLTTVAVFLPLVFVEGIAGQLFKDQALTITYALLASLAVALTFIPMALALGGFAPPPLRVEPSSRVAPATMWGALKAGVARAGRFVFVDVAAVLLADARRALRAGADLIGKVLDPMLSAFDRFYGRIEAGYPKLLTRALDNPAAVIWVTLGTIVAAVGLSATLGGELIPSLSQGEFSFELELPEGRPLEQTDQLLQQVENTIKQYPEVDAVFSRVGGSQSNQFVTGAIEENFGQLFVTLKNKADKAAEASVIERVRQELARRPDVKYVFSRPTLFSFKTPIEVEIYAFDLELQRLAADTIAARLAAIEGLGDIQTTTQLGNPEVQIRFDRARLARLGLEENQISQVLRNKIRGDVASRFREGDRQIDILVRAEEQDRASIADLGNLIVNAPAGVTNQEAENEGEDGAPVPVTPVQPSRAPQAGFVPIRLSQIAVVEMSRGPSEVRRIRSQRAAIVSASLTGRDLNSASRDVRAVLANVRSELPAGVTATLGGQNEELETSFSSLMFALGLAVFLVYLVMASQFESLVHPFIILFTVPLALAGVVISLAVTRTPVSVVALLGVIVLAGIVVNNAIILLDYANQLRREGLSKREAIVQAGSVRLRPIVMTTLTTVLGLAPMAIGVGEGAEIRTPMAVAVMGGLTLSTLLTLVLIPVVYEWADRKRYELEDSQQPTSADAAWQAGD